MKDQIWTVLPSSPISPTYPISPTKFSPPAKLPSKLSWQSDLCWSVADLLWSCLVVAPLVVIYWRGTWDLLEDLIVPPASLHPALRRQMSGLICYAAGMVVRIMLDSSKFHIGKFLSARSNSVQIFGTWLFNATFALAGVSFWRGVWFLMRIDVGVEVPKLLFVLLGSLAVLVLNKVPRTLISCPLAVSVDNFEKMGVSSTFFRKTPNSGCWLFVDVIFTNFVIRQLVVFCWWSLWSLENKFFFYQNMTEQAAIISYDSLLVGYAGAVLSLFLDKLIQKLTTCSSIIGRVMSTLVTLLAFFSSVNIWRGLWSFLNVFFLPNLDSDANYLIGHIVGLVSLTVLLLTSTIGSDGIVVDSETEEVVSVRYWRRGEAGEERRTDEIEL
eukprot:GFUD01000046.1.p1 GENE.GFUD01000046.1~~GFUD01000046.1.p1  ORF type:complete len:384 (+),score=70.50 GFUD01000046.1:82-1233(+)